MMNSSELENLRADVVEAGHFPDLEGIELAGRRRIARRRTVGVAAVAVVVAVAIGGVSLLGPSRQQTPASPNPLAGSVAGPLAGTEVLLQGPVDAYTYLPL